MPKVELIKLLKERYKDNQDIKFLDGKGWKVDLFNKKNRINIKITTDNCDGISDTISNQNFYEIYVYKGISDDIRENVFISRKYSEDLKNFSSVMDIIDNILLKALF